MGELKQGTDEVIWPETPVSDLLPLHSLIHKEFRVFYETIKDHFECSRDSLDAYYTDVDFDVF